MNSYSHEFIPTRRPARTRGRLLPGRYRPSADWPISPSAACGDTPRLAASSRAVTTGTRNTVSNAAGSFERAVQASAMPFCSACCSRLSSPVPAFSCGGDAIEEICHPIEADAQGEPVMTLLAGHPEGQANRPAGAYFPPETGRQKNAIRAQRLAGSPVHPVPRRAAGQDQGRPLFPGMRGCQPFLRFGEGESAPVAEGLQHFPQGSCIGERLPAAEFRQLAPQPCQPEREVDRHIGGQGPEIGPLCRGHRQLGLQGDRHARRRRRSRSGRHHAAPGLAGEIQTCVMREPAGRLAVGHPRPQTLGHSRRPSFRARLEPGNGILRTGQRRQ